MGRINTMNPKQERFANEYLANMDATKAAIAAGYSHKSAAAIGCQLLNKTKVKAYIDEQSANIAKRLGITQDYVLGKLKQLGENSEPTKKTPNAAVAFKSFEALGKHLRLFEEDDKKSNQTINIQIVQF